MEYAFYPTDLTRYDTPDWFEKAEYKVFPLSDFGKFKTGVSCPICRTSHKVVQHPRIQDGQFGYLDDKNVARSYICYNCLYAIFRSFVLNDPEHDERHAMYYICSLLNLYYNEDLCNKIRNDMSRTYKVINGVGSDQIPKGVSKNVPWMMLYIRAVQDPNTGYPNHTFYNSDNFGFNASVDAQKGIVKAVTEEEIEETLSPIAKENRSQILSIFHCDPFENESVSDRESMYNDLVTMADDAMAEDLVRQKAAIEIVRAFKRIDKLSDAIRELQSSPESIVEHEKQLKSLVEQKTKETQMVTSFSKDHGFAEKYAMSKSKGSGTLSAVVRDMDIYHYDKGNVNRYDIETSEAIKHVSDISAESIFKQLAFTDSDYAIMVKEQAMEMKSLREERDRLREEIRLIKEKHLKAELLNELENELRDKLVPEEDIQNIINREYNV